MPRGLTLPAAVLWQVITGLEELFERQKTESRVPPLLMCDRPDCSVYGRVGTNIRPEAVELRVWTGPRDSDAVTFEKIYLPEVIEALRASVRLLGEPEPLPMPPAQETRHDGLVGERDDLEMTTAVPVVAPEPVPEHITDVQIGSVPIRLDLAGSEAHRHLRLSWTEGSLGFPLATLDSLLSDIRSLYYDALRGMRGRTVAVGDAPIDVALHSHQPTLYVEFRGPEGTLAFPTSEIPAFLNTLREAVNNEGGDDARRYADGPSRSAGGQDNRGG
jgi:hypothetical protein